MALLGVELETFVSEPDALTTRPLPCVTFLATCQSLQNCSGCFCLLLDFDVSKRSFENPMRIA